MILLRHNVSREEIKDHVDSGGIYIQVVGKPGMNRAFIIQQIQQQIYTRIPYTEKSIKILVEERSVLC